MVLMRYTVRTPYDVPTILVQVEAFQKKKMTSPAAVSWLFFVPFW